MKRLLLVRHAKSSWADGILSDIDRPLNRRGKKDAPAMGTHLKTVREITVDVVLCSPARRVRATAKRLLKPLGYPLESVVWQEDIYWGDADDILGMIQDIDDVHNVVMVVGHNPDMTDLACLLSETVVDNMPTCGVFCIDFDVAAWQAVSKGRGKSVFFDVPKSI